MRSTGETTAAAAQLGSLKMHVWFHDSARHIERIRERMLRTVAARRTPDMAVLFDALAQTLCQPAKFVRSLGIVRIAGAWGGASERAYAAGAMVEIYHNATLLIDDILDNAEIRRGAPTLRLSGGTSFAIAAASVLRSLMFHPLRQDGLFEPGELDALHARMDETVTRVAIGQAREIVWRTHHVFDLADDDYIGMIAGKTGELFSASWALGALVARAGPEAEAALSRLGLDTGILFQLRNDYFDLFDSRDGIRRGPHEDLRDGTRTLFTVRCLRVLAARGDRESAARMRALLDAGELTEAQIGECLRWFEETGCVASVRQELGARAARLRAEIAAAPLPAALKPDLAAIVELLDPGAGRGSGNPRSPGAAS